MQKVHVYISCNVFANCVNLFGFSWCEMKIEIQTKVCKKINIIKLLQMKHLETMSLCHYVQGVVAGGETKCPDKWGCEIQISEDPDKWVSR